MLSLKTRYFYALLSTFVVTSSLPVSDNKHADEIDLKSLETLLNSQQPSMNQRPQSGLEDTPGRQYWDYLVDSLPVIKHYLKGLDECIQIVNQLQIVEEPSYDTQEQSSEELKAYQTSLCQLAVTLVERWGIEDLNTEDLVDALSRPTKAPEMMKPDKNAAKHDGELESSKRSYDSIGLGPFGLKGAHGVGQNDVKKVYDSIGLGPFGLKRSYDSIGLGPMGLKRSFDSIALGPMGLKRSNKKVEGSKGESTQELLEKLQAANTDERNRNDLVELRDELVEKIAKQLADREESRPRD